MVLKSAVPSQIVPNPDMRDLGMALTALVSSPQSSVKLLKEYFNARDKKFKKPFSFNLDSFQLECATGAPVKFGGSGIVLCATNREQPLVKYAFKVPRPSLYQDQAAVDDLAKELRRSKLEYINHAPLSHKNIAQFFAQKPITITLRDLMEAQLPTLLFEWVDGAQPLAIYLATSRLRWSRVIEILIQLFDALQHLHSKDLVHWDIKSDNFLISSAGVPKLTDIGNARHIRGKEDDLAYSTIWNIPSKLAEKALRSGRAPISSRRTPIHLDSREWDSPWLDLWMLARELNRVFEAEPSILQLDEEKQFPQREAYKRYAAWLREESFPEHDDDAKYAFSYVRLILRRLLHPTEPDHERYYASAAAVVRDLVKLQSEFGAAQTVPELQAIPQHVLRLPYSGNVPFTSRIRHLLDSRLVARTTSHLQLGIVYQIYPGATHKRSEHLFGVLAAVTQYIRALFADRTDPFWRIAVEQRDIEALLLAAVLHDVGHLAFGHALEEMVGIFRNRKHEDYAIELTQSPRNLTNRSESIQRDRKELTRILVQHGGIAATEVDDFLLRVGSILVPPPATAAIMDKNARLLPAPSRELTTAILHSIIDSAIDADKLDYLMRDAHHSGVQYPQGIDIDRFFQALTCVTNLSRESVSTPSDYDDWPRACIGITEKGILPAESIFIARYQMFSSVYWHHTVRAYTAMLQFCVQEFLGASKRDCLPRLDSLMTVFRNRSDLSALTWLSDKVRDSNTIVNSAKRNLLVSVCEALLGNRAKLYREHFVLQYKGDSPSFEEPVLQAKSLTAKLTSIWDEINKTTDVYQCIQNVRLFRRKFTARLVAELGGSIGLRDGEVLVDIPPSNKDQINNVFVVGGDSPVPIQHLSPVADGVSDTFRYWARRIRVFIAPIAQARLEKAGFGRDCVSAACGAVMADIVVENAFQRELFGRIKAYSSKQQYDVF